MFICWKSVSSCTWVHLPSFHKSFNVRYAYISMQVYHIRDLLKHIFSLLSGISLVILMYVNPCAPFNKWHCNCEFLFLYVCYCIQIKMSPVNNTYLVYQKKFLGRILGSCYAISRDFLVTCKRNETKWHQKGSFCFCFFCHICVWVFVLQPNVLIFLVHIILCLACFFCQYFGFCECLCLAIFFFIVFDSCFVCIFHWCFHYFW